MAPSWKTLANQSRQASNQARTPLSPSSYTTMLRQGSASNTSTSSPGITRRPAWAGLSVLPRYSAPKRTAGARDLAIRVGCWAM